MKISFLFTFIISTLPLVLSQNDCLPTRCSPSGPVIRFPFRLKDHQPARCGHPGFEISCTRNTNITKLDLQFPITITSTNNNNHIKISLQTTVSVWQIDYKTQKILASNAKSKSCLPEKNILLKSLNTTKTNSRITFEVEPLGYAGGYTLFNCSGTRGYDGDQKIACLGTRGKYEVIAFASFYEITSLPPHSSCFKMYNISNVPEGMFSEREDDEYGTRFYLNWREPSCGGSCEEKGKSCRLRNGGGDEEIECFGYDEETQHNNTGGSTSHKPLKAGIITAATLTLLFITIVSYFIVQSMKRKKEDKRTIEKLVDDHKDNMRPNRYSCADIKKITGNYKDVLYETLHKGTVVDKTPVIVKSINGFDQNIDNFISEVEIIGRMQHMNVLKLIGYCVNRQKQALVYEFLQNRTLGNFTISDDEILYKIALGIAKGINYICQECDGKILNLDNISRKDIFLDDNLEPKILVFPTAVADHLLPSTYDVVSKKAHVFGFGLLLLEILWRRRNLFHGGEKENGGIYYPEWIYNETSREENRIVEKLLIVGLWCTQWFPSDRPSIKCVVQMLEGENVPIIPPNPFDISTRK